MKHSCIILLSFLWAMPAMPQPATNVSSLEKAIDLTPAGKYSAKTIADGLISLDGERTEDVWRLSDNISSFTNPWNSEICPETSLSMLKDSKYLYFFFEVKDDDLVLEDDFSNERDVEKEDRVELFFSKDKEMNEYYCFETDAKGRVLSYRCSYYRNLDFDWDVPAGFVVAASIRPGAYSVEGAIPIGFFKDFLQNDEFIYFGAYRAEFSKKDGVIIENWLTWNNPSTAEPDFHVPLTLGKLYNGNKTWTYSLEPLSKPAGNAGGYYLGRSYDEIMASGHDILAEEILAKGEPDFDRVTAVLPPITKGAYCFLSGASSMESVIVDAAGNIYPERYGAHQPANIFTPLMVDTLLGAEKPDQRMLCGGLPILLSRHEKDNSSLELLYFIEATDPDGLVWIRAKRTDASGSSEKYIFTSASRQVSPYIPGGTPTQETDSASFWDAFTATVFYWEDFRAKTATFEIPNETLSAVANGAMTSMAITFSSEHPHYGHNGYGMKIHDNFPPNYIWSLEATCLTGQFDLAKRYLEYLLAYGTDYRGRFSYRQGATEMRSSSAVEYSQILFLINRYAKVLGLKGWGSAYLTKLTGMGDEMLAHLVVCDEFGGAKLIRMCAEADTNGREYVYLNNNLWAVRGLKALADILGNFGEKDKAKFYAKQADELLKEIRKTLAACTVENQYGSLVPFRLGYTATPLTLSTCDQLLEALPKEEKEAYKQITWVRDTNTREQDLTENTYANYRYYPEMLSSMLLNEKQTSSLVRMREALGGELLGMTRLWSGIDNWPVVNYARFLLENAYTDKYLLLLYAHTLHHGIPEKAIYFEQVSPNGSAGADCVPSLLTTPIMLAWMFAYETIESQQLQLLRAVPKTWFAESFSAHGIGTSTGRVDLDVSVDASSVRLSGKSESNTFGLPVVLYTRFKDKLKKEDILKGNDLIDKIFDDRITLKPGLRSFSVTVKKN